MIIQTVAQQTQKELEYHITEPVSLALESVFPNPYRLDLDFIIKRGQSEARLSFSRGKEKGIDPLGACGGGTVDVAGFGLKVSSWSLKRPKSRNVLLLDEPFKNINDPGKKQKLHEKTARMLGMVSEKLGLQIIIVTLNEELIEVADRVFRVRLRKGISRVKEVV